MDETPLCPYFGSCGGCAYQDLTYEDELSLKEENLQKLFERELGISPEIFRPIVPSPEPYGYRTRLDLSFRRQRGEVVMGFMSEGTRRLVDIGSCSIARPEISGFLPRLREEAGAMLPENYRSANLVVKAGADGRTRWGGIGRGSLRMVERDYFSAEIEGKRIFYSLDCFFQANLGILPRALESLRSLLGLTPETCLLDLYSGVGLFWVVFAREAHAVWAVEESGSALRVAEFNQRYHHLSNVFLKEGKTEDLFEEVLAELDGRPRAAIVDPPRQGLGPRALEKLAQEKSIRPLVYVSCHPPSLVRDLGRFLEAGWRVDRVVPHDFFPRTRHLETLVRLWS